MQESLLSPIWTCEAYQDWAVVLAIPMMFILIKLSVFPVTHFSGGLLRTPIISIYKTSLS